MPRDMKVIDPSVPDHKFLLKDIQSGKYQHLASCSSLGWGFAELYQIGYGRNEEYLILNYPARQETRYPYARLYIGGKQEAGRTWRALCKEIATRAMLT